jgi:hypothetical protein
MIEKAGLLKNLTFLLFFKMPLKFLRDPLLMLTSFLPISTWQWQQELLYIQKKGK